MPRTFKDAAIKIDTRTTLRGMMLKSEGRKAYIVCAEEFEIIYCRIELTNMTKSQIVSIHH